MKRVPSGRLVAWTAAPVAVALAAACATPDGDVFPEVSAVGDEIRVTFAARHPWIVRREIRDGWLEAVYDDGNGPSSQRLVASTLAPGSNTLVFRLPSGLDAAPRGGVCLHARVSLQGRAQDVPVRARPAGSGGTSGFEYAAWATRAVALTGARVRDNRTRTLEDERRALETAVVSQRAWLQKTYGGANREVCGKVGSTTAKGAADLGEEALLVEPSRQDREAHRVCTARIRAAEDLWRMRVPLAKQAAKFEEKLDALTEHDVSLARTSGAGPAAMRTAERQGLSPGRSLWALPMHLGWLAQRRSPLGAFDEAFLRARGRQIGLVNEQLKDAAGRRDATHVDSKGAPIPLQEAASLLQRRWILHHVGPEVGLVIDNERIEKKELRDRLTQQDIQGWIGAGLDAYEECVADVGAQFRVSWDAAQRKRDAPRNTAALKQQCEDHFNQFDDLEARLAKLPPPAPTPAAPAGSPSLPDLARTAIRLDGNACN